MEPFLPFKNFLRFQATPSLLPGAQPSLPASPSAGIIWGLHLSKDALDAAASPASVPGLAQGAVAGWEDTESPRATKKKSVPLALLQPGEPSAVLVYLQPKLRLEFTLSANPASPRN